jgi:hypothetical protein
MIHGPKGNVFGVRAASSKAAASHDDYDFYATRQFFQKRFVYKLWKKRTVNYCCSAPGAAPDVAPGAS